MRPRRQHSAEIAAMPDSLLRPICTPLAAVCLLACIAPNAGGEDRLEDQLPQLLTTASGVRFGIWPERPAQPAPTLFVLAGGIEDSLGSNTFRQSGNHLAKRGYLCVSVDLPCHGDDARPGEKGLSGWRVRCVAKKDIVADTTARLKMVLDYLIAERLTDPARVAALGTSRGGFMAVHFAAADPRVRCVAAFAPVTDLAALSEFRGVGDDPFVQSLALERQAAALAERPIWLVIGDRDERVSTDRAIQFVRRVTTAALEAQRSPRIELHVLPEPKGHTTPAGSAELAAAWIEQQMPTSN
jgi:dienelactone hydrolase